MSLPSGTALVAALANASLVGSTAVAAETRDPVTPETSGISGISGTSETAQDGGLVGDAYAAPGDNACSWRIGTDAVEKQLTFDPSAGTFTLTSFKNKLTGAEYIDATASSEFRTQWDGDTVTGSSPGWSCVEGTQSQVDVGGEPAIRVDVSVGRADLRVSRNYVIYPGESLGAWRSSPAAAGASAVPWRRCSVQGAQPLRWLTSGRPSWTRSCAT